MRNKPLLGSLLSVGQGVFYFITGVWPLFSIGTFQRVTGPKFDLWLVKTVGVLITVIGLVLTVTGLRQEVTLDTKILAVGSAAGLAGIDTVYVARRRISPIYLLDAAVELCVILLWFFVNTGRQKISGQVNARPMATGVTWQNQQQQ